MIRRGNDAIYNSMERKSQEPMTAFVARKWLPMATAVKQQRDTITAYVDELRARLIRDTGTGDGRDAVELLFEKKGKAIELYGKLMEFDEKMLAVLQPDAFNDNPVVKANIINTQGSIRTRLPIRKESPVTDYFKNLPLPAAKAMRIKIQADIEVTEGIMLDYLNSQYTSHRLICESNLPLVMLNSSYFKAGQQMEINAGIGTISYAPRPVITINGKKIEPNPDGVAVYRQTVNQKPGKYFIPVRIEFIQPDGSPATVSKKLEYIVAE